MKEVIEGRSEAARTNLKGILFDILRKEMRPPELSLDPDDLFPMPGMKDFLEWSLLRNWVKQWLHPEVSIKEFFKAPVVMSK